jgi:DNA polymerase III subunit alpha
MLYIPLHVHSTLSTLDSAIKVSDYVNWAVERGKPAIALTDHGKGHAIPDFVWTAQKAGVKPIVGVETYITPDFPMTKKDGDHKTKHHLVLLCRNQEGYRNLLKILCVSQTEGFYYTPRIDKDFLKKHSAGLIATSACISGEINRLLYDGLNEDMDEIASESVEAARKAIRWYKNVFEEDFYLEVQSHGIEGMDVVYDVVRRLGGEMGVKRIATTDSHYIYPEDVTTQSALASIRTKDDLGESPLAVGPTFHLWEDEEMQEAFLEDELQATIELAESVEEISIPKAPPYHIPLYGDSEEEDRLTLRRMCEEALTQKYPDATQGVVDRMEHELGIIEDMHFPSYFLIVADICKASRDMDLLWSVRGSAAGSLVAYLTGITLIDPLKYNLKFERFLNPARVNMPDIDLDYPDHVRSQIIEYTKNRYGDDHVAHIGAWGYYLAKSALKDAARVWKLSFSVANKLSKLIPDGLNLRGAIQEVPPLRNQYNAGKVAIAVMERKGETEADVAKMLRRAAIGSKVDYGDAIREVANGNVTVQQVFEKYPSLEKVVDKRARINRMLDLGCQLEGGVRNISIHAAGILVSDVPLDEQFPILRASSSSSATLKAVSQWPMDIIDKMGGLKVDFLGLRTLQHVQRVMESIRRETGEEMTFWTIPVEDADDPRTQKAYDLLCTGDTSGCFQVESPGMRGALQDVRPRSISEVADVVALYRPGPMDSIPDYVAVKRGEKELECVHPDLKQVLDETHGVCVFQEQVMQIAQLIAGFSGADADLLRYVISKKKIKQIPGQKRKFIGGALGNGYTREEAQGIWDSITTFARYGFNKAHAVSYAFLTVITAWLKANYPWHFLAELIATESGDTDKMGMLISEAKEQGYVVTPPDINRSLIETRLVVEGDDRRIVLGLKEVKHVGKAAYEIVETRGDTPFEGLGDFLRRCEFEKTNSRTLKSLAKAGAFDEMVPTRSQAIASAQAMSNYGRKHNGETRHRQPTLFEHEGDDKGNGDNTPYLVKAYQEMPILEFEKEVLGTYVTEHPLDDIEPEMVAKKGATRLSDIKPDQKGNVTVVGLVTKRHDHKTKKGTRMGFVTLTSPTAEASITVWPSTYKNIRGRLKEGNIVLVEGYFNYYQGRQSIVAESVEVV